MKASKYKEHNKKTPTLRRKARGALSNRGSWARLVRNPIESQALPLQVEIWCQKCQENTIISPRSQYSIAGSKWPMDKEPKWTAGEPAKYIEPKPICLKCTSGIKWPWKRFIPVNPEIPSIDMDELRHWGKVHSFMTTEYAIKVLAARRPMPRTRNVQAKPGFGRTRAYRQRERGP